MKGKNRKLGCFVLDFQRILILKKKTEVLMFKTEKCYCFFSAKSVPLRGFILIKFKNGVYLLRKTFSFD
ncbi:hypothetical protein MSSIT_1471 [Methanosarcina siciliae T4/M]|uniref:Uncharacterized protein n=2 Tax=Methanosarcina siciliae TaxID=38027 RepID=A0A0E3PDE0_9EURY|nr:hypothetical protein MSSIT_1471 [Methanosarcina siciliae T4/M]AKB32110.1 hypothetical protein MSSIH_1420 [Methanosarcina siciliae HI350]